jgi:hypothetical protein
MPRKKRPRVVGKPFAKGFDPRRHQLTRAERSLGFRHALASVTPKVRRHLRDKVSWWYAKQRQANLRNRKRTRRPADPPRYDPPW